MRSIWSDRCRDRMSAKVDTRREAVPSSSVSSRSCGTQLDPVAMMLHRAACSMVLQRRAAAARELYPTRPAYRSRPSPPAGRSRRVRLLIWARRVAASRLRRIDGIVHRGCIWWRSAHAAPRHPGPFRAVWLAVRCLGPPGPCLGTTSHLAGCVWRAYGRDPQKKFVVYNKAVQNNRGGTRLL